MAASTEDSITQPNNLDAGYTANTDMLWNGGGLLNGGGLGLNLDGNGLTVGVWEAVEGETNSWRIRNTHRELENRVTFGETVDETETGFSNHATHVAGTIAATGRDRRARGMANRVNLRSYSSANDIAELQANAGLLVASNHSYNMRRGWEIGDIGDATDPVRDVNGNIIGTGTVNDTDIWRGNDSDSLIEDSGFGKYGAYARDLDNTLFNNPLLLSVWSAGNDRDDRLTNNTYVIRLRSNPNIPGLNWTTPGWYQVTTALLAPPGGDGNAGTGYDSLPDAPVAKNTLVVGSVTDTRQNPYEDGSPSISNFSSWGPTDDGRIKPDVVAKGEDLHSSWGSSDTAYADIDGTSMSAPVVTGTSVLLIQHFQNLFNQRPRSATTKGLLIHTATDLGNAGPDYQTGWGLIDGTTAADFLTQAATQNPAYLLRENSYTGTQQTFNIASNGTDPLKVTLAWTDPAGPIQAGGLDVNTRVLVNDLDLSITDPNGVIHFPWTLNPNNPAQPAVQVGANNLDNVEQVLIDTPIAGNYTINIGHAGNSFTQDYSLFTSADENDKPIANANGKYFVSEGGSIPLFSAGSFDSDGFINAFHWDLNYDLNNDANDDGSPFDIDVAGASPVFDAKDLDADRFTDNIRKIALGIIDNRGATDFTTVDLEIVNVPPTAFVTGDTFGVPGLARRFNFSAIDPSKADTNAGFTFNINYGDGTGRPFQSRDPFTLIHTYTSEGDNTVTVTATDKDGGVSNVATHIIEIRTAGLLPDPDDPSKTCLYVGATLGSDQINVVQQGGTGVYEVLLNNQFKGSFSPSGCIIIYGQDGNDNFDVPNSHLPVKMYGSAGNDSFRGGIGEVSMFGGIDNDIYNIDSLNDFAREDANEGDDTVNASTNYVLGGNLENLNLIEGTAAHIGIGNELRNFITGNSYSNYIDGGYDNDTLYGYAGDDRILGGNENDTVIGGQGADILTGGSDNDMFVYNNISDAGDRITDFTVGSDKIILTDIVNSSGWQSSNLFADGFLLSRQASSSMAVLMIDPDGHAGRTYFPAPFILFDNVSAASLGSMSNFVV